MKHNFKKAPALLGALTLVLGVNQGKAADAKSLSPAKEKSGSVLVRDESKNLDLVEPGKKYAFQEFDLSYSYVGDAKLGGKNRGNDGDLGEQSTRFSSRTRFPINDRLSVLNSLDYDRFDFSRPGGSFLPQNLQQFSLNFGLSYVVSDEWTVFGRVGPTLSLINGFDIYSDNIYVSGILGASYRVHPNLDVQFGMVVAPDNGLDIPVLPFAGGQWRFAENWQLNLGLPKTSVDWNLQPNLRWSMVEAQYAGGTYHTDGDYGNKVGFPQLNNKRLNYREVRVGTRITYAPVEAVDLHLGVGAAVYRNFDFDDVNNASPTVDPAPYVQVGAKVSF